MVRRMVLWRGLDEWTAESARVEIGDGGLRATGTQLGAHPFPYRLDYALDATGAAPDTEADRSPSDSAARAAGAAPPTVTGSAPVGGGFVTRHLRVAVAGDGWRRSIDLLRGDDGAWRCGAEVEGAPAGVELAEPGLPPGAAAALGATALDCDLAFSPLTNLMPIRRHRLDREPGERTFTMAWVSVPDLRIHADEQRYEHVEPGRVRFSQPSGFTAELLLDVDGLVRGYPGIAERL